MKIILKEIEDFYKKIEVDMGAKKIINKFLKLSGQIKLLNEDQRKCLYDKISEFTIAQKNQFIEQEFFLHLLDGFEDLIDGNNQIMDKKKAIMQLK